jgi:Protein of unknown function (DUF1475)
MTAVSLYASLESNVMLGFARVAKDRWGLATLFDAYFGFLWFWLWVSYKEASIWKSLLALIALLALGNFAIAGYVMLQLWKLPKGAPLHQLLLRAS